MKSNIKEANKHLQALYTRVTDLETALKERDQSLEQLAQQHDRALGQIVLNKDSEIADLKYKLDVADNKIKQLEKSVDLKSQAIDKLESHSQILNKILRYRPVLEKLLNSMDISDDIVLNTKQNSPKKDNNHDSAVSDLSANEDSFSTTKQLKESFEEGVKTENFSIEENGQMGQGDSDDVFSVVLKEKEYYL